MKIVFCILILFAHAAFPENPCETIRQPAKASSEELNTAYLVEKVLCEKTAENLTRSEISRILANKTYAQEILVLNYLLPELIKFGDFRKSGELAEFIGTLEFSTLEQERRQALGDSLVFLINSSRLKDKKDKLAEKLYSELPDLENSRTYFESKSKKTNLERLKNLTKNNQNKLVIKESREFLNKTKSCEAEFYLLKALRKDRQYVPAFEQANKVVNTCGEPWKRKAFYFAGLLQNIRPKKNANGVYDLFFKKYGNHSYSDDMLYWKARVALEFEGKAAYFEILNDLVKKYPGGDYFFQAGFELAINSAEKGKESEALKYLERLKASRRLSLIQLDQIAYWQARLKIYPKPNFLHRTKHDSKFILGVKGFEKLIQSSPTSYYSMLARQNLRDLKVDFKINKLNNSSYKSSAKILANYEPDSKLEKLLENKYFRVAKIFVDKTHKGNLSRSERLKIAVDYAHIGRHDKSHLIMRKLGLAQLAGEPDFREKSLWSLGFPRLFSKQIFQNTKDKNISPNLLEGLIREESQFYAPSVSWAGAMGLCQFMPATGLGIARKLKLKDFQTEDLLKPELSLMLGGYYLNSLLQSTKHPFLTIASYNAGLRNISRTKQRFFSELKEIPIDIFIEKIAIKQTRDYVKRVSSSWGMYAYLDDVLESISFDLAIAQK